jgi:hypothetical protein
MGCDCALNVIPLPDHRFHAADFAAGGPLPEMPSGCGGCARSVPQGLAKLNAWQLRPVAKEHNRSAVWPLLRPLLRLPNFVGQQGENPMKDAHNKAAEHHESAAKSHRSAAESHDKNDHAKGKEHSTQARQQSQSAEEHSKTAHAKSNQQK